MSGFPWTWINQCVSDTAQVLIFIRGVNKSYKLLDIDSIHGTTAEEDNYKGVDNANEKNPL